MGRSLKMKIYGDRIMDLQPAVNFQLEGTSAWINMLTGADSPPGMEKNTELDTTI